MATMCIICISISKISFTEKKTNNIAKTYAGIIQVLIIFFKNLQNNCEEVYIHVYVLSAMCFSFRFPHGEVTYF